MTFRKVAVEVVLYTLIGLICGWCFSWAWNSVTPPERIPGNWYLSAQAKEALTYQDPKIFVCVFNGPKGYVYCMTSDEAMETYEQ